MKNRMKGFTLVELSIVLVIIGLLIGGILVGQSLMAAANISSTASQLQQFDAAFATYKDKYRALPGDFPNGNRDGLITCVNGCSVPNALNTVIWRGEIASVWRDLTSGKFVSHTAPIISGANKSAPASGVGKKGSFLAATANAPNNTSPDADTVNIKHYYSIISPTQLNISGTLTYFLQTTPTTAAVKPTDALALDKKLDDGIANSGYVLSGSIGNIGWANVGTPNETSAAGCSSGASYTITTNTEQCTPMIRIGGQTGNPL